MNNDFVDCNYLHAKMWCLTDSPSQPYWWGQSRGLCQESDAGSGDKHCVEPLQSEGQKGEVASD